MEFHVRGQLLQQTQHLECALRVAMTLTKQLVAALETGLQETAPLYCHIGALVSSPRTAMCLS